MRATLAAATATTTTRGMRSQFIEPRGANAKRVGSIIIVLVADDDNVAAADDDEMRLQRAACNLQLAL